MALTPESVPTSGAGLPPPVSEATQEMPFAGAASPAPDIVELPQVKAPPQAEPPAPEPPPGPLTEPVTTEELLAELGSQKSPGLLASDTLAEAGRKIWRYHFTEMLKHEAGTRLGADIEELHDMRVATRRMRAAFEIFGTAYKPKVLKKHLRGLRQTGRTLGAARDMDVILEKAEIYRQGLPEGNRPGLEPLLQFWEAEQAAARASLETYLDSPDYTDFKRKFYRFVTTPGAGESSASPEAGVAALVCEQAPVLIYSRLAAVRSYEPFLPSASLEQLHALRIEFKKLRYTVEFFREVLGEEVKAVINDLKGVQDHLGDLNDASVVTGILSAFLASWDERQAGQPIGQRQNPEATIAYLANRHAERHHLMTTFAETWVCFVRPEFRRNLALAVSAL